MSHGYASGRQASAHRPLLKAFRPSVPTAPRAVQRPSSKPVAKPPSATAALRPSHGPSHGTQCWTHELQTHFNAGARCARSCKQCNCDDEMSTQREHSLASYDVRGLRQNPRTPTDADIPSQPHGAAGCWLSYLSWQWR